MELFFLCVQVTKAAKYVMPSRHSQNLCNIKGDYHALRSLTMYVRHLKYIHSQNRV